MSLKTDLLKYHNHIEIKKTKIVMRAYKSRTTSLKDKLFITCYIHTGEELEVNMVGNVFNEIIDLLVLGETWSPRSIKP